MSTSSAPTKVLKHMNQAQRAHFAKETINNFVPHLLKHDKRAEVGVNATELIHHAAAPKARRISVPSVPAGDAPPAAHKIPRISVLKSDTFDAASCLLGEYPPKTRVGVLNMCSVYQPGGGVLHGAMAQEESLCLRSTLFQSLSKDPTFYRLPEDAAIYSPDVLVFRDIYNADSPKAEQFYVDVISVAAPRGPEVDFSTAKYVEDADREAMRLKIKTIFQVARAKGVKVLVLGALGCGAYGNPPEEVAALFHRVMVGHGGRAGEDMEGIDEVVFAIFDEGKNLNVFRHVFGEKEKEKKLEENKVAEEETKASGS